MTPEEIDAALIAAGHPAECVTYVCPEHRRHCCRIGTEHDEHRCYWCDYLNEYVGRSYHNPKSVG